MTVSAPYRRNILFAPAAGPGVGGGHVMRCLTLAGALLEHEASCTFVGDDAAVDLIARFGGGRFAAHRASAADLLSTEAFEALVIDDYAVAAVEEAAFRGKVRRLVVIDDLADRPHLADLLIDPGYGRAGSDYQGLLPETAIRLTGPDYALVNPAFARRRTSRLAVPVPPAPARLFTSFGLADPGEIAARAVSLIRARFAGVAIDVALGSDAASVAALQARARTDANLHLHLDTLDVAELMAAADLAIGAGGASTWERCCLGLPTLAVIVADNQRAMIRAMASDGALLAVDARADNFEPLFHAALQELWTCETRISLSAKSAALCDGLGAGRIAAALLAL